MTTAEIESLRAQGGDESAVVLPPVNDRLPIGNETSEYWAGRLECNASEYKFTGYNMSLHVLDLKV